MDSLAAQKAFYESGPSFNEQQETERILSTIKKLETEINATKALYKIQGVVDEQAEDEGLWFVARTAPEAYLQAELRRLHAVIEEARNGKD